MAWCVGADVEEPEGVEGGAMGGAFLMCVSELPMKTSRRETTLGILVSASDIFPVYY